MHRNIYRMYSSSIRTNPFIVIKTTPLYLLGGPASLLVVVNTHPPLSLVCQQLPHPLLALPLFQTPAAPHSSCYIIYTDDISNSSRPCLEQFHLYRYFLAVRIGCYIAKLLIFSLNQLYKTILKHRD
jgi:hypothetical protein